MNDSIDYDPIQQYSNNDPIKQSYKTGVFKIILVGLLTIAIIVSSFIGYKVYSTNKLINKFEKISKDFSIYKQKALYKHVSKGKCFDECTGIRIRLKINPPHNAKNLYNEYSKIAKNHKCIVRKSFKNKYDFNIYDNKTVIDNIKSNIFLLCKAKDNMIIELVLSNKLTEEDFLNNKIDVNEIAIDIYQNEPSEVDTYLK